MAIVFALVFGYAKKAESKTARYHLSTALEACHTGLQCGALGRLHFWPDKKANLLIRFSFPLFN
jgi:hypothetical protein